MKSLCMAALAAAFLQFAAVSPAVADKGGNSLDIALGSAVTTLDNYRESDRGGLVLARLRQPAQQGPEDQRVQAGAGHLVQTRR